MVDDVCEEFHSLLRPNLHDWPGFYPLCELIYGNEQVRIAPRCSFEGPNQIKPLDREWPRDRDCLECLSQQMGLPSIELTPFTSANNPLGIGYCGGPVEALSESFAN
jgi:hypothetical protein